MRNFDFDIIYKYFSGVATPEEAMLLEDWKMENTQNQLFFDELFERWSLEHQFKSLDIHQAWEAFKEKNNSHVGETQILRSKKMSLKWLGYAASVMIFVSIGLYYFYNFKHAPSYILAQVDTLYTRLEDSTQLALLKGSSIEFSQDEHLRTVLLDGSAFFNVHKQSSRFVVNTSKNIQIEDIGTQFWVEDLKNETKITVVEGVVMVKFYDHTIRAIENDIVELSSLSKDYKVLKFAGDFSFINQDVETIVLTINQYFNANIEIHPSIKQRRMTLTGKNMKLTDCVNIIANTLDLKMKNYDDKIELIP